MILAGEIYNNLNCTSADPFCPYAEYYFNDDGFRFGGNENGNKDVFVSRSSDSDPANTNRIFDVVLSRLDLAPFLFALTVLPITGCGSNSTSIGEEGICLLGEDVAISDQNNRHSRDPAIAFTGSEVGVAWQTSLSGNESINVALVAEDGAPLDEESYVISTEDGRGSRYPSIDFTGNGFGLAWQAFVNSVWSICFNEISIDGIPSETYNCLTDNDSPHAEFPSMAWNSETQEHGLVWQDRREGFIPKIYFLRVAEDGSPIGESFRISELEFSAEFVAIVAAGNQYGIVWQDTTTEDGGIRFQRVSDQGEVLGERVLHISEGNNARRPSIVWNGFEFGITWDENQEDKGEVFFARVSPQGELIGDVIQVAEGGLARNTSVNWNGEDYGISWVSYSNLGDSHVRFRRVTTDGEIYDPETDVTNETMFLESSILYWTGDDWSLVWAGYREETGVPQIYVTNLNCIE